MSVELPPGALPLREASTEEVISLVKAAIDASHEDARKVEDGPATVELQQNGVTVDLTHKNIVELPEEAGCPEGMCGKLDFWLYGFRPAAAAWEKHYAGKLEDSGFLRGVSCGVVFYHPERDISCVVHGDDFSFGGLEEDLVWIASFGRRIYWC